jgi:hypothetical protein
MCRREKVVKSGKRDVIAKQERNLERRDALGDDFKDDWCIEPGIPALPITLRKNFKNEEHPNHKTRRTLRMKNTPITKLVTSPIILYRSCAHVFFGGLLFEFNMLNLIVGYAKTNVTIVNKKTPNEKCKCVISLRNRLIKMITNVLTPRLMRQLRITISSNSKFEDILSFKLMYKPGIIK